MWDCLKKRFQEDLIIVDNKLYLVGIINVNFYLNINQVNLELVNLHILIRMTLDYHRRKELEVLFTHVYLIEQMNLVED